MKNIAIMQPYFFPYLGYFQLINKVDNFLLYGHVDFKRRSYMTRNSIVNKNYKIEPISVRTKKSPLGTKINEIKKINDECQNLLMKKVTNTYSRFEYFNEIFPLIKPIIAYRTESLMDYNSTTLKEICHILDIKTNFIPYKTIEQDFLKIEKELTKEYKNNHTRNPSDRVIRLCKYFNTNTYINPEGGVGIYNAAEFTNNDIILKFHKSNIKPHRAEPEGRPQHASIIDILMMNGLEGTKIKIKMGDFFLPPVPTYATNHCS